MSIRVVISSREEAEYRLAFEPEVYTHLISIHAPDGPQIPGFEKISNAIELEFDDVTNVDAAIRMGYTPPDESHVDQIVRFARAARKEFIETPTPPKDITLLAHCAAGISRSAAAAYIFLLTILGPDREHEAFGMIMRARPQASPNSLMLSLANESLGINQARREAWMAEVSPCDVDDDR